MKALLWKDWHVNRPVFLASVVLVSIPFAIVVLVRGVLALRYPAAAPWSALLGDACKASQALCWVAVSLLGGYIVAGERSERSAEFLAGLPVARRQLLASKLVTVCAALLALWLFEALCELLVSAAPRSADVLVWLAVCALALGAAWLGGTWTGSPSIGTAAGLAAPVVLLLLFQAPQLWTGGSQNAPAEFYAVLAAALGLGLLAAGSWHFVRHVEG